jgi:hypothetical protein
LSFDNCGLLPDDGRWGFQWWFVARTGTSIGAVCPPVHARAWADKAALRPLPTVPQSMLAPVNPSLRDLRPVIRAPLTRLPLTRAWGTKAPVILQGVLLRELILRAGIQHKAIQLKVIPPPATRARITPHRAIPLPVTPMLPAR